MKRVSIPLILTIILLLTSCSAIRKAITTIVSNDVETGHTKDKTRGDETKKALKADSIKIEKLIANAESLIGKPYCFGGIGPNCFDCSGFTQVVFKEVGIDLPRMAGLQAEFGKTISKIEGLKRGDLVFFTKTWDTSETITHVGLCVGPLKMLHAPSAGYTIMYANLSYDYWQKHFYFAKRLFMVEQE